MSIARPGQVRGVTSRRGSLPDRLILILLAWGIVITIAGPRIWEGIRVFAPQYGLDSQVAIQAILMPTSGNLAQSIYLTLATVFILSAGRLFPVDHRMYETAMWVSICGAFFRLFLEPVWPKEILQNMPTFNYQTSERLSGTFYEPSLLGLHLIAAAGYFTARAFEPSWKRRIASFVALAIIAVDFLANASGTAVLGFVILGALGFVVLMVRVTRERSRIVQPWIFGVVAAGVAAAIVVLPFLINLTVGTTEEKVGSDSFVARSTSNAVSWQVFLDTTGFGAGLGSNRPSSFFFFVLSTMGVIGVGLLGTLIGIAIKRSLLRTPAAPVAWGFIGSLVAAMIAVPDLSSPIFWTGLAACLAVTAPRKAEGSASPPTELLVRASDENPAFEGRERV